MKLICIASLTIIGVLSQTDCSYGGFSTNPSNNKCMFDCEYDANYVEISTLSFDFIKDRCSGVSRAAEFFPSECNSLDDLVYAEDYCSCPYCKCSDLDGEVGTLLSYVSQVCLNCTCSDDTFINSFYGIEENIIYCDSLYGTSDPIDWNNYQCPPETCTETEYDGDINQLYPGDLFWGDVGDSDTKCTKFCYCSAKEGEICATGYANILADDILADQFHYDCGSSLEAVKCYIVK